MCTESTIDVGFSSGRFRPGTHICLVFRDEAVRRDIVSKFVDSGARDGERVFYFADTAQPSEVVDWLASLDVDVGDVLEDGSFTVDPAVVTYCPDGSFVPDRMLGTLREAYTDSVSTGYAHARVTGEMSWALRGFPGSDRLMEYEAAINHVVLTHPITAMCQYDANAFSGDLIFRALQVHPYMVMSGQLVKNPYYTGEE